MKTTVFRNKYAIVSLLKRKNQPDYTIVKLRPGVVVIALTNNSKILLVQQHRVPLGRETLELPAGLKDRGDETIIQTAKRELLEETGYAARDWAFLGWLNIEPNIISTKIGAVLALDCNRKSQQKLSEETELKHAEYSWKEIDELVKKGSLNDAASIAAIYKAKTYLKI